MLSLLQLGAGSVECAAVLAFGRPSGIVAVLLWLRTAATLLPVPPAAATALLGLSGAPGGAALLTRLPFDTAGGIAGNCAAPKFLQADARSSAGPGGSLGA